MKKILLTTTAVIALSSGYALADGHSGVKVTGDARLGIDYNSDDGSKAGTDAIAPTVGRVAAGNNAGDVNALNLPQGTALPTATETTVEVSSANAIAYINAAAAADIAQKAYDDALAADKMASTAGTRQTLALALTARNTALTLANQRLNAALGAANPAAVDGVVPRAEYNAQQSASLAQLTTVINRVLGSQAVAATDPTREKLQFTNRIRIKFAASGDTDLGLQFGGEIRADNAVGGKAGTEGNAYISGAFGKLSMGDVASGDKAVVGQLEGVGLTGLGDLNEVQYNADSSASKARALYELSADMFKIALSSTQTAPAGKQTAFAGGVSANLGQFSVAAGFAQVKNGDNQATVSASADLAGANLKLLYQNNSGTGNENAVGGSFKYNLGDSATAIKAFYIKNPKSGTENAFGVGFDYDLGGSAKLQAGFARQDLSAAGAADVNRADFGVSFSF